MADNAGNKGQQAASEFALFGIRWLVQRETNMYVMSFLEISERMSGNSDGM
jgi:hypothetical protein